MYKRLANLNVDKSEDYYNEIVKALKNAGFLIVLDCETTTSSYYIVAKEDEEAEKLI